MRNAEVLTLVRYGLELRCIRVLFGVRDKVFLYEVAEKLFDDVVQVAKALTSEC